MARGERKLLRSIAPRALKAAFWGFITFLMYYIPYRLLLLPALMFPAVFPFTINTLFNEFLAIAVFFAVAIQLFHGTILQHVLSVAKALTLITYFIYAFKGGIITLTPSVGEATFKIIADIRVFLAMLILIYLLGLAKSIIQAINFLASEKDRT